MAEYVNIPIQEVAANQNVIFNSSTTPCNKGIVIHRAGSGQFTVKSCTNNCRSKYRIDFSSNIAIPTGGTVGAISLAITVNGEADLSTNMIVTPAAVDNYFNVSAGTDLWVPSGCCVQVSIKNTSGQAINVQNANITINRLG